MQVSHTLIVALMYVTVLSFGLAGLMSALAMVIRRGSGPGIASIHIQWIVLLLLVHFSMVWHAVYLTH